MTSYIYIFLENICKSALPTLLFLGIKNFRFRSDYFK